MAISIHTPIGLRKATERIVKQSAILPLTSRRMSAALLLSTCAIVGASFMAWITSQQIEALAWSVWPIVGSLVSSVVAILAPRPKKETQWTTLSRFLGAIVVGMALPRVLCYTHPWIREILSDSVVGIGSGFVAGMVGFTTTVVFLEKLYLAAPSISDGAIRKGKEAFVSKNPKKP